MPRIGAAVARDARYNPLMWIRWWLAVLMLVAAPDATAQQAPEKPPALKAPPPDKREQPGDKPEGWWCAPGMLCQRDRLICEEYRNRMTQDTGPDCSPQDVAYCFHIRDASGTAPLLCAGTLA